MAQIVVAGAGVSGLSCAVRLLESGHEVVIVSKQFTPHTTSDIAAAMWWPFHAEPEHKVLDWCMASYDEFVRLSEDSSTGVKMRSGTFGFGPNVPRWAARIPGGTPTPARELPDGCAAGLNVKAPMVEMNVYMPWLMKRVSGLGAKLVHRSATSVMDLQDEGDLVVNTTGLGARELVNDTHLFAARGRALRFEQAGIENFVGSEAGDWPMHVFPRSTDVVVGGTYEANIETVDEDPAVDASIAARAIAAEPKLAEAKQVTAITGFRPSRYEVRLEREVLDGVDVVHNYGHGGGGVTLSWGCADAVVELAAI